MKPSTSLLSTAARWRKSSYSNDDGGACVEVAPGFDVVPVRDSKDPAVGHLMVTSRSWAALVASVKAY